MKLQRWLGIDGPFEFRQVWPRDELNPVKRPPIQHIWFRLTAPIDDSAILHRALLAYASDFHLIGTATLPHGISYMHAQRADGQPRPCAVVPPPVPGRRVAAVLVRQPHRAGRRGLARGQIFSRDGRLVASTAQEGLIRLRDELSATG